MKVKVIENKMLPIDEIHIICEELNQSIKDIVHYAESVNYSLMAKSNNTRVKINPSKILYIESVDKKSYIYLENEVLESNDKLYQLENKLNSKMFFRANKSTIINVSMIKKVIPQLNRSLIVILVNDEKCIISRRNVKEFNKLIEME